MPLSEAPEREPPQTVGQAIQAIEAALAPYPRILGTQFQGDMWDELHRSADRLLSDPPPSRFSRGTPSYSFFLAQYLVNLVCQNILSEISFGKVCLPPDSAGGRVEMRSITDQDARDILQAVEFLLGFVQIDLCVRVVMDGNDPFVPPLN